MSVVRNFCEEIRSENFVNKTIKEIRRIVCMMFLKVAGKQNSGNFQE